MTSPPAGVSRSYFDVALRQRPRQDRRCWAASYGGVYNTDIWEWDTTTGVWAQLMPAAGSPVPDGRYYHTIAYDSIRRADAAGRRPRTDVTGFNGPVNDSWEWDANLAALERDHADRASSRAALATT